MNFRNLSIGEIASEGVKFFSDKSFAYAYCENNEEPKIVSGDFKLPKHSSTIKELFEWEHANHPTHKNAESYYYDTKDGIRINVYKLQLPLPFQLKDEKTGLEVGVMPCDNPNKLTVSAKLRVKK